MLYSICVLLRCSRGLYVAQVRHCCFWLRYPVLLQVAQVHVADNDLTGALHFWADFGVNQYFLFPVINNTLLKQQKGWGSRACKQHCK